MKLIIPDRKESFDPVMAAVVGQDEMKGLVDNIIEDEVEGLLTKPTCFIILGRPVRLNINILDFKMWWVMWKKKTQITKMWIFLIFNWIFNVDVCP